MAELDKDSAANHAVELLKHYGFDLGGYSAEELVYHWSRDYPISWLRSAVIEALYQGRYKAISVEQILTLWRRRGQPIHHFNHEFERIICSRFPTYRGILTALADTTRVPLPAPRDRSTTLTEAATIDAAAGATAALEVPNLASGSTPILTEAVPAEAVSAEAGFAEPVLDSSTPAPDSNTTLSGAKPPLAMTAIAPSAPASPPEQTPERLSTVEPLLEVRQGELPIQTFKPHGRLELATVEWCNTDWSRTSAAKQPIHQFIPTEESPNFYSKLKAVAQHNDSTNPHINLATLDRQPHSPNEP